MTAQTRPADVPATPVPVWAVAGLVATLLAVVSALATPLMGLPDEPAHAVHAVAVVRGEVAGADVVRTDPASGWTRTETELTVPAAYAALPELPACFAFRPTVAAGCAPDPAATAGPSAPAVSTVGTYAPPWYALVGWPSLVLPPTPALVGMRLAAALVFGALVAVAAAGAWRAGARRWGLVGLTLAVPPVAVHLAGGINPSGTEVAAAVALWTCSAALVRGAVTRGDVGRWLVAGLALALVRPLGPILAVAVPLAVVLVLGSPPDAMAPWRDRRVGRAGVVVVAASVIGMAWNVWRGTLSAFSGFPAPELSTGAVLRRSAGLVPERFVEMVGVLGWADVSLPRLLTVGWLLVTGVLVVAGLRVAGRRARSWLLLLGLAVLLLPVAADLRSASQIGFVWQGRYTLPVAVGLPLLSGLLLDLRGVGERGRLVSTAAVSAVAVGHLVALLTVLRRFRVGAGGDLVEALGTAGSHVALSGWALAVLAVVALVPTVAAWHRGPGRQAA